MSDYEIKVSAKSDVQAVAKSISIKYRNAFMKHGDVAKIVVSAIGSIAIASAIKAVAIARGYILSEGISLVCVPAFDEQDNDNGTQIKIVKLIVYKEN